MEYYNLDMVLSIGYRVKSKRGVEFRQWANKVLKEYMLKGYSINQKLDSLEKRIDNRLREHDSEIQRLSNQVDFFRPPFLTADRGNIFLPARYSMPINSFVILSSQPEKVSSFSTTI